MAGNQLLAGAFALLTYKGNTSASSLPKLFIIVPKEVNQRKLLSCSYVSENFHTKESSIAAHL